METTMQITKQFSDEQSQQDAASAGGNVTHVSAAAIGNFEGATTLSDIFGGNVARLGAFSTEAGIAGQMVQTFGEGSVAADGDPLGAAKDALSTAGVNLGSAVNSAGALLGNAINGVGQAAGNVVQDVGIVIGAGIVGDANTVSSGLNALGDAMDSASKSLGTNNDSGTQMGNMGDSLNTAGAAVGAAVALAATAAGNAVTNAVAGVATAATNAVQSVGDAIIDQSNKADNSQTPATDKTSDQNGTPGKTDPNNNQ